MFEFADYSDRITTLENKTCSLLEKAGVEFHPDQTNDDRINLVFAGQYSAGKSTLLKC